MNFDDDDQVNANFPIQDGNHPANNKDNDENLWKIIGLVVILILLWVIWAVMMEESWVRDMILVRILCRVILLVASIVIIAKIQDSL
jgi:hypothetical protein